MTIHSVLLLCTFISVVGVVHELSQVGCRVDCFTWNAIPILSILILHRDGLGCLTGKLASHELVLMLLLRMLVIALHEVGQATTTSGIQHLLAVLRCASHHLIMVLLLFQFVVESLELLALVGVSKAVVWSENCVDVLAKWDFGTEPIHQVGRGVIIAASIGNVLKANVAIACVSIWLGPWELIEVGWLLLLVSTTSVTHWVSLKLVESTSNALDLRRQFKASTNHYFVRVPLGRGWIWISVDSNNVVLSCSKAWGCFLAKSLVAFPHGWLADSVVIDRAEAVAHKSHLVAHHVVAHLTSSEVLSFIFNDDLLE